MKLGITLSQPLTSAITMSSAAIGGQFSSLSTHHCPRVRLRAASIVCSQGCPWGRPLFIKWIVFYWSTRWNIVGFVSRFGFGASYYDYLQEGLRKVCDKAFHSRSGILASVIFRDTYFLIDSCFRNRWFSFSNSVLKSLVFKKVLYIGWLDHCFDIFALF